MKKIIVLLLLITLSSTAFTSFASNPYTQNENDVLLGREVANEGQLIEHANVIQENSGRQLFNGLRSVPSSIVIPVKIVTQKYSSNCWAAVMSSIGYHQTGINFTQDQIADKLNVSSNYPVDIYTVRDAFDLYNIGYNEVTSPVSGSEIVANMINQKPIFAIYVNDDFTASHSVAIVGYNTSSSDMGLVIMDPNYSSLRSSYYNSSSSNYTIQHPTLGNMYWYSSYTIK